MFIRIEYLNFLRTYLTFSGSSVNCSNKGDFLDSPQPPEIEKASAHFQTTLPTRPFPDNGRSRRKRRGSIQSIYLKYSSKNTF